jgi:hypothetical protein
LEATHHERHVTRIPPKLALPWILEEDWPQWQAIDHNVPSYGKWVELFDKNLKLAEAHGWPYARVSVRPDSFNEWCKANQRTVGKFDRNVYALELLRKDRSVGVIEETREKASGEPTPSGHGASTSTPQPEDLATLSDPAH